jgi:hypothetical protein
MLILLSILSFSIGSQKQSKLHRIHSHSIMNKELMKKSIWFLTMKKNLDNILYVYFIKYFYRQNEFLLFI